MWVYLAWVESVAFVGRVTLMLWISGHGLTFLLLVCTFPWKIWWRRSLIQLRSTIIIKRTFALSSSYWLSACTNEIVHSHPAAHSPSLCPWGWWCPLAFPPCWTLSWSSITVAYSFDIALPCSLHEPSQLTSSSSSQQSMRHNKRMPLRGCFEASVFFFTFWHM